MDNQNTGDVPGGVSIHPPHFSFLKAVFIILLLFVIASIATLIYLSWKKPQSPQVVQQTPQNSSLAIQQAKAVILQESVLQFDKITSSSVIDAKGLPHTFSLFMNKDAKNPVIMSVKYGSNDGFVISYTVPTDITALHNSFLQSAQVNKWKVLSALRTSEAGLIDLQEDKSIIEISYQLLDSAKTGVSVQIHIENKK